VQSSARLQAWRELALERRHETLEYIATIIGAKNIFQALYIAQHDGKVRDMAMIQRLERNTFQAIHHRSAKLTLQAQLTIS
jgi:hypothetical protein